jgi:hypothetical protein
MDEIEARLLARAGNPVATPVRADASSKSSVTPSKPVSPPPSSSSPPSSAVLPLAEDQIVALIKRFKK